jgi:hypothetical protein
MSYFRIVPTFFGREHVFLPKIAYEQIRSDGSIFQEVKDIASEEMIKEICFAKTVTGCLFAISMFLKEVDYYIYQTNESPDIDLSDSDLGDFPSIQEVRYRKAVEVTYVGILPVSEFLIHRLRAIYDYSNMDKQSFDNRYARLELDTYIHPKIEEEIQRVS